VIADDSQEISANVIQSDLILMASPIIMGFISELLKRITDRLIPLLLPHVILVGEECHHKKRYDRYPLLGLLLQKEEDTDDEDIEIITEIYRRMSINLHSRVQSVSFIDMPVEEVCHEIGHI